MLLRESTKMVRLLLALFAVWTTGSTAAVSPACHATPGIGWRSPATRMTEARIPPVVLRRGTGNPDRIKPQYLGVGQPGRLPHKRVNAVSTGCGHNISGGNVARPQSLGVGIYYSKSPCVFKGVVIITVICSEDLEAGWKFTQGANPFNDRARDASLVTRSVTAPASDQRIA